MKSHYFCCLFFWFLWTNAFVFPFNETLVKNDTFNVTDNLQTWRNDNKLQHLLLDDDLFIIGVKASRYSQNEMAQLLYARIIKFQEQVIDLFAIYMDAVLKKEDDLIIKNTQETFIVNLVEYERSLSILCAIITPEVKGLITNSFPELMSQDHCLKIFRHRSIPSILELSIEFLKNPRQMGVVLLSLMLAGTIADIYRYNHQDVLRHEAFTEYVKICLAIIGSCMTSIYFMINSRKLSISYDRVFIPKIHELLQKISLQEKALIADL